ncbi:MAG: hypothetical protein AAFN12_04795 [Cyanobacteria bacterium J06560_2]
MELQQRISHHRVRHIVESYCLSGDDATAFDSYLGELLNQYPHGVIELALIETLIKSWLTIPMVKGLPFLRAAHHKLKQWQQTAFQDLPLPSVTPSQFTQITGLDAQVAFTALTSFSALSAQATAESA